VEVKIKVRRHKSPIEELTRKLRTNKTA